MNKTPTPSTDELRHRHLRITQASPWVERFTWLIPENGSVLDLAAGGGRHSEHLLKSGYRVTAVDQHPEPLEHLKNHKNAEILCVDLETPSSPFAKNGILSGRQFDGIVCINYLHRPLFDDILKALNPGGVLIYETFQLGNEAYARPRNPDHLLKNQELLDWVQGQMQIIAFEQGIVQQGDIPGVKQRVCAIKDLDLSNRDDQQPDLHPLYPMAR